MIVKQLPLDEAVGHILVHNQTGSDGRRILRKGKALRADDVVLLQGLGKTHVYAAILEADDLNEDEAAQRLGNRLAAPGIITTTATTGRVNLVAEAAGLFKVKVEALLDLNDQAGITLGTLPTNTHVEPRQVLGTLKIIPYSIPKAALAAAEAIARQHAPLVELRRFVVKQATLITTGSPEAREKVVGSFTPALRDRLAKYGTALLEGPYVAEEESEISAALRQALEHGAELILVAGETSIMDTDDITPRAIKAAGGEVIHHGVPVEPGNLLLLAYRGQTPIVGAPGCARSPSFNVIDLVLPRLASGEQLSRRDLVALGHGGFLKPA